MGSEDPKPAAALAATSKMPALPESAQVSKRPVLRPPIASPFVSAAMPKVLYVRNRTPFFSAIKHITKLLDQVEKREKDSNKKPSEREWIFIKGTGRAVDRACDIASWFEQRGTEYEVKFECGDVVVIDDIYNEHLELDVWRSEEADGAPSVKRQKVTSGPAASDMENIEAEDSGAALRDNPEEMEDPKCSDVIDPGAQGTKRSRTDPRNEKSESRDQQSSYTRQRRVSVVEIGVRRIV